MQGNPLLATPFQTDAGPPQESSPSQPENGCDRPPYAQPAEQGLSLDGRALGQQQQDTASGYQKSHEPTEGEPGTPGPIALMSATQGDRHPDALSITGSEDDAQG